MKKGEEKKPQICVNYKGGELILPPGHKVFELNTKTGKVYECKLKKERPSFDLWIKQLLFPNEYPKPKNPTWIIPDKGDRFWQLPAFDIKKARIEFKKVSKSIGYKVDFED